MALLACTSAVHHMQTNGLHRQTGAQLKAHLMRPTSSQLAPPLVLLATPRERRPRVARSAMYLLGTAGGGEEAVA